KPITALGKVATPIIGWIKSNIKEVTAKCNASVTHITMAKIKRAMAAWPAYPKPGIGTSITTINANIANGIPKIFKFSLVFKPPK
ncbi:MAG: hypothetical protein ACXVHN_06710, partial [Methanobacterium sp.]